uniref:Uncharacterized protein n=1 Tax=Tanacetum cinerariifolium TaxID=118510 RepID=A0A699GK50_TANCI|nr:hypothetical protein [Tanacetum cinerariifolium]
MKPVQPMSLSMPHVKRYDDPEFRCESYMPAAPGGGMNSYAGSGGDGNGNDIGTSGGRYSDDGSAGAAKHLARRSSVEGGDSEMSGNGGGVSKEKSLSASALDRKGMGS